MAWRKRVVLVWSASLYANKTVSAHFLRQHHKAWTPNGKQIGPWRPCETNMATLRHLRQMAPLLCPFFIGRQWRRPGVDLIKPKPHTHSHTSAHTLTHIHALSHTHAHTHTHTHTHTLSLSFHIIYNKCLDILYNNPEIPWDTISSL